MYFSVMTLSIYNVNYNDYILHLFWQYIFIFTGISDFFIPLPKILCKRPSTSSQRKRFLWRRTRCRRWVLARCRCPHLTYSDACQGCFLYIENLFTELKESRAFELLRSGNDRSNYLLTRQARIVAMTCTHAALKVYFWEILFLLIFFW